MKVTPVVMLPVDFVKNWLAIDFNLKLIVSSTRQ
jgi:hypothetical protein